ncbi:hypothetical protein J6590_101112, partial [Homalodisca vitripennis]
MSQKKISLPGKSELATSEDTRFHVSYPVCYRLHTKGTVRYSNQKQPGNRRPRELGLMRLLNSLAMSKDAQVRPVIFEIEWKGWINSLNTALKALCHPGVQMTSEILEHLLDIRLDKTVPFQEVLDKRLPFQELLQHPQVPEEVLPAGPRDDRPDQQDRAPSRRHVPYETAKEKKLEKYASVARLLLTEGYRTSVNAF